MPALYHNLETNDKTVTSNKVWTLPPQFRQEYSTGLDDLGCGGSGHIFSAVRRRDRKEVAVKLIPKACIPDNQWVHDDVLGLVPKEVHVLRTIDHASVICFIDFFQDDRAVLIVMELFGSSWRCSAIRPTEHNPFPSAIRPVRRRAMDLFELLEVKPLTEDDAHTIFLQIITAVDALFTNYHLIHGDIKDENILIDWSGTLPIAKLIDFGGALQNVDTNTRCTESDFHGTLEFAPPEIVLGKGYDPEKAEAWSLGVLLYGMVNRGSGPFATPHQTAFGGYQLPKCSDACQELIGRMLVKDQRYRAGFKEILEHPWVVGKR